jgi:16S rRNA (cytosine967-C5)-methyltransferase
VPESEVRDGRQAAWLVLQAYDDKRIERLAEACEAFTGLAARDAGLARELALGVVRWQRLYDALGGRFLRAGNQPPPLLRALRLAAHQLFALDRIPAHAACDGAVELLRQNGHVRLTGVANAVVRRLAGCRLEERRGPGPLGRLPEEVWPQDLATRHSLTDLLVADLRPLCAGDEDRRLGALNLMPHLCTRTRPGRPPSSGPGVLRQEGEWTWWNDPQEALRGAVAAGEAVVQDRTQGLMVELGGVKPGDWVLDLCAAPGGKSLAFADRGCRVVAGDIAEGKAARLRENLGENAALLVQDGTHPALEAAFDLVVVDAPCSNTGVLGRRPEARWRYTPKHLDDLNRLQRELLSAAADLAQPGGRLIYGTCSLSPRENQGISHQLAGWRVVDERLTWPDEWQGGGYVAVMERSFSPEVRKSCEIDG